VAFHNHMLFIMSITYMMSGVFTRLSYMFRRRPPQPTEPVYEEAPQPR